MAVNMFSMGRRSAGPLILAMVLFLVALSSWRYWPARSSQIPQNFDGRKSASHLPCWDLPGAKETVVVLRTGATELEEKLPAHLDTTTRCFPNYAVYSDFGEYYNGQHIVDALESVSETVRMRHPDFELYRRLKSDGRSALSDGSFLGATSAINGVGNPNGNSQNPGWKLDKWKFLPMVNRTLYDFPDMKWYVFTEVDAYVVWNTMLQYLSTQDPTQLVYRGQSMSAGADFFVYGGAGFIVSRPALQAVADQYASHKEELEAYTDHNWAGDAVLGKAFKDAGVAVSDIWPFMQGDYPGWLTYLPLHGAPMEEGIAKAWCKAVATFHHVTPDAVRDLWHAEQEWMKRSANSANRVVRHVDLFEFYTLMQTSRSPRPDWDSDCDQEKPEAGSEDQCEQSCRLDPGCVQYSFEESSKTCRTRAIPRLGIAKAGFRSGWLRDRMEKFPKSMPNCGDEINWPT